MSALLLNQLTAFVAATISFLVLLTAVLVASTNLLDALVTFITKLRELVIACASLKQALDQKNPGDK